MGLFTNPVVLNDGSADHTFNFRAQLPDKKAIVGEWVEPASALSEESKITVKHDSSSAVVRRRLIQRTKKVAINDGSLKLMTVNLTVTHHPEHSSAEITKQISLLKDTLNEANFVQNFLMGLI